jgi:hypothetical protein
LIIPVNKTVCLEKSKVSYITRPKQNSQGKEIINYYFSEFNNIHFYLSWKEHYSPELVNS